MKTFKIFVLVSLVLTFTLKVNAQTVVTKEVNVPSVFGIDCVNEWATGTIIFQMKEHFNSDGILIRWQQQVSGVFTGDDSGTV